MCPTSRAGPRCTSGAFQTCGAACRDRVLLFTGADYVTDQTHPVYDVAPDGRHFVMVRSLGGTSHLKVTLNLFQNLPGAPR
jgi:hypothetical protein